jgi:hypothetical protein
MPEDEPELAGVLLFDCWKYFVHQFLEYFLRIRANEVEVCCASGKVTS